jgi:hypothetical protein
MSAASLGAARPRPSATLRTAGWLVGRTLRILAVVAPLLLLLATGLAPAVMASFAVEAPGSLWSFTLEQAPGVFTLVIAAMTMAHLATHLAFGMTRRSFAAAVVLTVFAVAAAFALLVPVGYVLEGAHFRAYGWEHLPPTDLASAVLASFLRSSVWGLAGALSAVVWYRFGGFVGVVALPLTAVVPIVSTAARLDRAGPLGVADVAVLVGVVVLLAAAYAAVVLGVAVKARSA